MGDAGGRVEKAVEGNGAPRSKADGAGKYVASVGYGYAATRDGGDGVVDVEDEGGAVDAREKDDGAEGREGEAEGEGEGDG